VTDPAAAVGALTTLADQGRRHGRTPMVLEPDREHASSWTVHGTLSVQDFSDVTVAVPGLELTGELHATGFDPAYLRDAVRAMGTGTVRFHRDVGCKPVLLSSGNGFQALVMPVRLPG